MIGARGQEPSQSLSASSDEDDGSSHHQASSGDDGLASGGSSSQDLARSGLSKATGRGLTNGSSVKFHDSVAKFNAGSKSEIRELKGKLLGELNEVRSLLKRLEEREVEISRYGGKDGWAKLQVSANNGVGKASNLMRMNSEVGSVGIRDPCMQRGVSASAANGNDRGGREFIVMEERPLKSTLASRSSDFVPAKKMAPSENKKVKKSSGNTVNSKASMFGLDKQSSLFKSCYSLLTKLMKHNYGWVFNSPVDVKDLGLHDYFTIISQPMDLGTAKTKLKGCSYESPQEFAYDVRLTFQNAMKYNPPGQDVHLMADTLLKLFEKSWGVLEKEHNLVRRPEVGSPTPATKEVPSPAPTAVPSLPKRPDSTSSERLDPRKPVGKESVKRDMTFEEKQRLSEDLQNLPSEKLEHVVHIIRKRNSQLFQLEDEIEVDIDVVDAETLWELQEFVDSYKSSLNKLKRKADMSFDGCSQRSEGPSKEKLKSGIVGKMKRKESAIGSIIHRHVGATNSLYFM
ncbi:hypothetical protein MLD38_000614 [Melastoma candidum]|uniref:Uncharacterized protein n=1 Tax=Melastoma candidum TaxID=119954 RepID=A0ACB9SAL5_9MYRT|nr:hypothetical protein MLD38_000614 [Melastoma candidum]